MVMLCSFIPMLLFAQADRTNDELPVIADKPVWVLTKATGWMKNYEGQWLEGKNLIPKHNLSSTNKESWKAGINAVGKDNFKKIEVRDMTFAGQKLLILLKYLDDGYFDYPKLGTGWKPLPMIRYYVLKKNETKPKAYDLEPAYQNYTMETYFLGLVPDTGNALQQIKTSIAYLHKNNDQLLKFGSVTKLRLFYTTLKDGTTCRFHFHTVSGNEYFDTYPYGSALEYNSPTHVPVAQYYFECPKASMTGFIDLIQKQ